MKLTKLIALIFALCLISGCSKPEHKEITSIAQMNDRTYTIGYGEGHSAYNSLKEALPKAKLRSFSDLLSGYEAVKQGKIDGYAYARLEMELAMKNGVKGLRLLKENLSAPVEVAVGLSPITEIPDLEAKINEFITQKHADGTISEMNERWFSRNNEMPKIPPVKNPKYTLTVGTTGNVPPYSFYKGTELTGYDIELSMLFAQWLGAKLEFKVYDYAGIIAAALSGDIDCIMANLNVTPERKEKIHFSIPIYKISNTIMVRDSSSDATADSDSRKFVPEQFKNMTLKYNSIEEMAKKPNLVLGMHTGFVMVEKMAREMLPHAKIEYYKTNTDLSYMTVKEKLDGFINDEPVIRYAALSVPDLGYIRMGQKPLDIVVSFQKNDKGAKLRDEFNEYLRKWKKDGTLKKIDDLWLGTDEDKKIVDLTHFEGKNGVIKVGTDAETPPFEYIKNGKVVGYEIDLLARFCREAGYALEIHNVPFDSLLMGLKTGMYDVAADCLTATDAIKEATNVSEPVYLSELVMAVKIMNKDSAKAEKHADAGTAADATAGAENADNASASFTSSLSDSFKRTFVREDRWKLIASGIGVTVLISVLSALFGTILGFGLCGMRLSGNRCVNGIALAYIRLMQGLPMVVLLMILFYIVFAKTELPGLWVAVIGFGMNFGAYVSEMIRTGILAVDKGQTEAALALGYTKPHAFVKIVLPQAARHFLPVFQGEFISLVKMTSVVGYIAIQDLTKAGDIIRSRTYEAFFPLITTAVIYFVISWVLTRLLVSIQGKLDVKKRRDRGRT